MMAYAAYATQIERMLVFHLVHTFHATAAYRGTSLTARDASFATRQLWKSIGKIRVQCEVLYCRISLSLTLRLVVDFVEISKLNWGGGKGKWQVILLGVCI